ncbi:hypothetical protein [Nocardia tengchongensis]
MAGQRNRRGGVEDRWHKSTTVAGISALLVGDNDFTRGVVYLKRQWPAKPLKTVQARMRHASARTTLDTYGHLWPDADESTRFAVGEVIAERMDSLTTADELRTEDLG